MKKEDHPWWFGKIPIFTFYKEDCLSEIYSDGTKYVIVDWDYFGNRAEVLTLKNGKAVICTEDQLGPE